MSLAKATLNLHKRSIQGRLESHVKLQTRETEKHHTMAFRKSSIESIEIRFAVQQCKLANRRRWGPVQSLHICRQKQMVEALFCGGQGAASCISGSGGACQLGLL